MNFMSSLLFYETSSFHRLESLLRGFSLKFILPVFFIALLLEFIGEMEFKGVFKRLMIALLFINFFAPIHKGVKKVSFQVSESIVSKFNSKTSFISIWKNKIKREKRKEISSFKLWSTDLLLSFLWVVNKITFYLLKCLYSVVFHFAYAFCPLIVLLSILPVMKGSLYIPLKASLWCFLMPIISASMLVALDGLLEIKGGESFLVYSISDFVQMLVYSFMLLSSGVMATKLINGQGFEAWAEKTSGTFSLMSMILPAQFLKKGITSNPTKKALGLGGDLVKGGAQNLHEGYLKRKEPMDQLSPYLGENYETKGFVRAPGASKPKNAFYRPADTNNLSDFRNWGCEEPNPPKWRAKDPKGGSRASKN